MSQPAARISDMHVCPMQTPALPPIPHVGGPILPPGEPKTLIGGLPAARVGDMCTCVGPPDVIVKGSLTVMIGGKPAARMGDTTAHGGTIVGGFPKVMIGDQGSGAGSGGAGGAAASAGTGRSAPISALATHGAEQKIALQNAAADGSAFCEVCDRARKQSPAPSSAPQRALLLAAAANGVPFCEECAKAARAAAEPVPPFGGDLRSSLKQAAADGSPFCAECAAARAAERH